MFGFEAGRAVSAGVMIGWLAPSSTEASSL
jgi:hypothetical protein